MSRSTADDVLALLADREVWTGARLAETLGVGLRTVRRALTVLREDGVSLDADVGRGGGIRLGKRAGLPRLRLKHGEALTLLLALALAESLALPLLGQGLPGLRRKLSVSFQDQDRPMLNRLRQRILVGAPASEEVRTSWRTPRPLVMRSLQEAFVARNTLRMDYVDATGRNSARHVEPHYLLLNHPAWYVLAFDQDRQAGRSFRIDRIHRAGLDIDETTPFRLRQSTELFGDVEQWFTPL
jgi:predicted DNA-binding transcriptional regulator YafY